MTAALSRRAALLLPLGLPMALGGCEFLDNLFTTTKVPIPGDRVSVMPGSAGLAPDPALKGQVRLPPPSDRPDSPQPGVTPTHVLGHPALPDSVTRAWDVEIGEGSGYRQKILAQPVVSGGRVFVMDSDGAISAYDVRSGGRLWRVGTKAKGNRSTNVGGGVAVDGSVLYATTGRGEAMALDPASGKITWRVLLGTAARSAPTVADGRLYVTTLDNQMIALALDDGHKIWGYQAADPATSVLGLPAPAFSDGLLLGGFGGGDLIALRAVSGAVVWTDSLGSARGRNSLLDLSSVHAMPVIAGTTAIAVSLGGLMLGLDLRSGRRLWERDVAASETPCVAGGWVFVLTTDQTLAALAVADGRVAWTTQLPVWARPDKKRDPIEWLGPVLAGDRLLVVGSNETAMSVSPYTGEILGQIKLSGKASVAPVVAGGTVFVVTDDGRMIALR